MNRNTEYYLGLDIGTDSVGYAVTDEEYKLLKFKGEPMWGSHLFDPANQCAERRAFRVARRRLDRRQQRVQLADEIFASEVAKVDPHFYIRKKESALWNEDSTYKAEGKLFFNDSNYSDKDYHKEFPTIHHLLMKLIKDKDRKFDIRLLNIAVDWLVAHRGHFLSEVDAENIEGIKDFTAVYNDFYEWFTESGNTAPWGDLDAVRFGEILKTHGINGKKNALRDFIYGGKIPADQEGDYFSKKELISLLAGGKVSLSKLFPRTDRDDEEEDVSFKISDDMEETLPKLGDYAEVIKKIAAMYDWSVLSDLLGEYAYISEAKVQQYEQHKIDLKNLKYYIKKNPALCEKYNEIFKKSAGDLKNYVAYTYQLSGLRKDAELPKEKAKKEDFYKYLESVLKIKSLAEQSFDDKDESAFWKDVANRMAEGTFLPKQVNTDNRVIPYQLYYVELERILENAANHYPFLSEVDSDGYKNIDKLKSIMKFRIPYFVGPLRKDSENAFGWIERKGEGKIYPWNFNEKVDLDKSEEQFIRKMTNICTYLPGEPVVPKYSLLYAKFMALNEINNLKVNEVAISVKAKQEIFTDLFCKRAKVTRKQIQDYLVAHQYMEKEDVLSGIDITVKSSLKAANDFRRLMDKGILTESDVERIVERRTFTEENGRFRSWVKREFPNLSEEDKRYVSARKYSDFGRLSERFLNGLKGVNNDTGEIGTILHFLWETNDNLMEIISSDKYSFGEEIQKIRKEYYTEHPTSITDQMEEMGLPNAVRRSVTRTLAVVKDVVQTAGHAPKKIFVEMARGADPSQKGKRTTSRKEQILELYKQVDEDTRELEKQLEEMGDMANNRLQSEALFLYYLQLGKCMYSGKPIRLEDIKTTKYNIDHIYPQSLVKDDSTLNNKVLVLSELNGRKTDTYPIEQGIRHDMYAFWKMLKDRKLITEEKFSRLIRNTPFTEQEKLGFINRQLVETRQSMKAVTNLLKGIYPDSEIIYVKANLAAELKQVLDVTPKVRSINDLHHAKDAYLNIVAGNVHNERFTKNFYVTEKYSIRPESLYGKDRERNGKYYWNSEMRETVKKTYEKNNIHLTRYAFCQKGGLFDQMPLKKKDGLIERKAGLDTAKYGGYNKSTSAFFVIARYLRGGKKEVSFVPIDLMVSEKFLADDAFALEYLQKTLEGMNPQKKIENVELPLKKRVIRYKTVLSLDGFRVWVNGKASGGRQILLTCSESLSLSRHISQYVKKIENYINKKAENKRFIHDSENDGLCETENENLYDEILNKLQTNHYMKMPGNQSETVKKGREKFVNLSFDEQLKLLVNAISLLKSGRAGGVDLSMVGGKSSSGAMIMGANLSSCKYKDVRVIDYSPAGLHENKSNNLMELFY